jgi:hypothetical protein
MKSVIGSATRSAARGLLLILGAAGLTAASTPRAAAQFVSSSEIRPFVVGLIPVVGRFGVVGGVSVDAQGVLARSEADALGRLRDARLASLTPVDSDLEATNRMRKVSLRRLLAAIDECRRRGKPLDDALQNVAGLTRVQYIFAAPEQNDIVLAGPAEGWHVDAQGNVVGRTSGQPVLQLDDLIVALRTAKAAGTDRGISCSIDPTDEGLRRVRPLLASRSLNQELVSRMEQALGPQTITVTGVPAGSHFARVLISADFLMKRLGMGFEQAPIEGLPSYMKLLTTRSAAPPKSAMPRWWMAPYYQPLLRDSAGLAWQLRGSGVQTLTEDGYLGSAGAVNAGREDPLAKKWADTMTSRYEALSKALPVFAELRNCMDLAVVAALLVKEDLPAKTGCDLSLVMDEKRVAVAEYSVPKTVDSRASLVRKGQDRILSLSGGVQIDSWSVVNRMETRSELGQTREQAVLSKSERWWWD